jgi:hypothetical protein
VVIRVVERDAVEYPLGEKFGLHGVDDLNASELQILESRSRRKECRFALLLLPLVLLLHLSQPQFAMESEWVVLN